MRNKKTIGIVVGAAVIVAAIIAGIIVFMTTRATPQRWPTRWLILRLITARTCMIKPRPTPAFRRCWPG